MASGGRNPRPTWTCFDKIGAWCAGLCPVALGGADDMDSKSHGTGGGQADVTPLAERESIGHYLKQQRELRGISAEELAGETRIPLRSLERLEAGSFDGEIDGFVRGFVRTVAEALGLDPDDTISRMLAEPTAEEIAALEPSPLLPRAVVGLAAVVLIGLAIGLVRIVSTSDAPRGMAPSDQVVHRLDPVKALAEAQAASGIATPGPVGAAPPESATP